MLRRLENQSQTEIGSSTKLENVDDKILDDEGGHKGIVSETCPAEKEDNNGDDIEMEEKSHSEDKDILFDSDSFIREMQLKDENKRNFSKKREECPATCMKKRNLIALLSFFGFFNVYCLRVDLSITLVAMTNKHIRMTLLGEEYMVGFYDLFFAAEKVVVLSCFLLIGSEGKACRIKPGSLK